MKMFTLKSVLTMSVALNLTSTIFAGEETGKVRFQHGQIGSNSTSAGITLFFLDGSTKTGTPSCATFMDGDRWAINNDSPAAKIQMSILLAAAISGKNVRIRGTNECGVYGDSETARDISL